MLLWILPSFGHYLAAAVYMSTPQVAAIKVDSDLIVLSAGDAHRLIPQILLFGIFLGS